METPNFDNTGWVIWEDSGTSVNAIGIVCAVGAVLCFAMAFYLSTVDPNSLGQWSWAPRHLWKLGALFLLGSIWIFHGWLISATVDGAHRQIVLRYQRNLRSYLRVVPFHDIDKVLLLWKGPSLARFYRVGIRLRGGEQIDFQEETNDKQAMAELAGRLEQATGASCEEFPFKQRRRRRAG
jgi:hypothetical protein